MVPEILKSCNGCRERFPVDSDWRSSTINRHRHAHLSDHCAKEHVDELSATATQVMRSGCVADASVQENLDLTARVRVTNPMEYGNQPSYWHSRPDTGERAV